jgi:tripartite-type tricarboxylate transporter receptor subunit TctC
MMKAASRYIRHCAFAIAVFAIMAGEIATSRAQEYPNREIHLIDGYAAGAGGDVAARIFARYLEEKLGKPVIVENRPGAFTNLAAGAVARSEPDGYTLMFSGHTAIATNMHLFKTLPFDPVKDFVAIAHCGVISFGIGVPPESPAKTLAELTALLKQKGDKATYGYANAFGLTASELYKNLSGAPGLAIPYKNSSDALTGLLRGDIDFIVYDLGTLTQQEIAGRARVVAVTTAGRSLLRPDVPGMKEAGLDDYDLAAWFGIWAPANTPAPIVNRLSEVIKTIWEDPEKRKALSAQTIEPLVLTPEEFTQYVLKEMDKWGRVVSIAKIEKQ